MECSLLLRQISLRYQQILGRNLVGISVHGSLAFGCFRWESSDVDFLVVTRTIPAQSQKVALIQSLLDLAPLAPPKGLEMSLVLLADCAHFRYPTPFCLHFSPMHLAACQADLDGYCRDMHGLDHDLAAHFMIARQLGFSIYGPPPQQLFGPIPRSCYLDSILRDIEGAEQEAIADPTYFVLNQCRVLAYLRNGQICSKAEGGLWGLEQLDPQWAPLIQSCLTAYRIGSVASPKPELLLAFCAMIQKEIRHNKRRTS